jgi:hypothetical protein
MLSNQYKKMAFETQLYYDGYPDDTLEKMREKLWMERERLANITNPSHFDTFEKFINYVEEEDTLKHHYKKEPENSHCTYCKCLLDPTI